MTIDEILGSAHKLPLTIVVESDQNKEVMDIGGVPQEHREVKHVSNHTLPLSYIFRQDELKYTCHHVMQCRQD